MKSEAQKRNIFYLYAIGFTGFLILAVLGSGWFFAFKISAESAKIMTESLYLNEESDKKTETAQKIMEIEEDYSRKHGLRGLNANQNMVKNNIDNQANSNIQASPNPETYPQIEYPNQQQQ